MQCVLRDVGVWAELACKQDPASLCLLQTLEVLVVQSVHFSWTRRARMPPRPHRRPIPVSLVQVRIVCNLTRIEFIRENVPRDLIRINHLLEPFEMSTGHQLLSNVARKRNPTLRFVFQTPSKMLVDVHGIKPRGPRCKQCFVHVIKRLYGHGFPAQVHDSLHLLVLQRLFHQHVPRFRQVLVSPLRRHHGRLCSVFIKPF
mmetsp:Transcript_12687/g.27668  ORF Transcript_12687/g.27668 Transcript_12687/m.27668 type:complete len:201 (+) Transcript_12687:843-1445(+)